MKRSAWAALAGAALALSGCGSSSLETGASQNSPAPAAKPAQDGAFPSSMLAAPDPAPGQTEPASSPVRVSVPSLGVNAGVEEMAVDSDTLQVPERGDVVGWMTSSADPGATGPMVLVGHVDTDKAPAVFYELANVAVGAAVVVTGADGAEHSYAVSEITDYVKGQVPLDRLYGPTTSPVLRLVTCSGDFDRATGHYEDNTVVYAEAT